MTWIIHCHNCSISYSLEGILPVQPRKLRDVFAEGQNEELLKSSNQNSDFHSK
jgi:hypothetical protein